MNVTDWPFSILKNYNFHSHKNVLVKAGDDDCAVIKFGDSLLILTTDYINSKPASISLGFGSLRDLGYLAATANLSDLLGTGAEPVGFLLGVKLERSQEKKYFEEVFNGADECLKQYGIPILGGDTKLGDELSVYGTAIGKSNSLDSLFIMSRAKVGQTISLSGPIGGFNAAVWAMSQPNLPEYLLERCKIAITHPTLPYEISRRLAATNQSRAGTDISDGLGAELHRIARASTVGIRIESDSIPIHPLALDIANYYKINPLNFVFATGGDYQFIVTGPPISGCYTIGTITSFESGLVLNVKGENRQLPSTGHDDSDFLTFQDEINKMIIEVNL